MEYQIASPVGWQLLQSLLDEPSKSSKSDLLLAYTHLILLHHGFKCLGTEGNETNPGETLPELWKSSAILYEHIESIEKFQLIHSAIGALDSYVLLNFHRLNQTNDINALILNVHFYVDESYDISNHEMLSKLISEQLVTPFHLSLN